MFRIIVDLYSLQVKYKVTSATDRTKISHFSLDEHFTCTELDLVHMGFTVRVTT